MKLLTERVENAAFLVEERGGKKSYFIEGIFLQSNLKNRNNRIYPKQVMEQKVADYIRDFVDQRRAFGELGHPDSPTVNLDRTSHMILSLEEDGDNYVGKAKILNTPMGNIVQNLLDEGAKLGVSSRAVGSLRLNKEGVNEVCDDLYISTAADIVADPSAPDAFVNGIMEGREFWYNPQSGTWTEESAEHAYHLLKDMRRRQVEEIKGALFEQFLKQL